MHVHPAAIALTGRRTAAVLAWAELGLSLGRYSPLVPALRTLAVEQPLHEGLAARLMLALAGAGQQAEALTVYQDLRDRLSAELGVDPGPEITSAHLRVLRGQLPGAGLTAGAGPRVSEPPAQLPMEYPALRLLGQARDMHRALHDRRNEAETCRRIAEAYRDLGDLEPAAAHARQAVTLARETAVPRFEISARSTLATILVRLGEPEQGLAEHTLARDLAEGAADPAQQAEVLMELAESMAWLGRLDEALIMAQDVSAAADHLRIPLLQRRAEHAIATTSRPPASGGRPSGT